MTSTPFESGDPNAAKPETAQLEPAKPAFRYTNLLGHRPILMIGLVVVAFGLATWGALFFLRSRDSGVVVLQGNIDVRQLNLSFKAAGRIAEMNVDEGDRIDAGKIVAVLDKSYFTDDVRLSRARVAAQAAILARLVNGTRPEEVAQARDMVADRASAVVLAQATLERKAGLADKGISPHQEHDEATATAERALAALKSAQETLKLAEIGPRLEDIDAAKAQLEGENAALVQAERRLTDSDLIAPSGGVILTRVREPGAIVGVGETVYAITITSPVWVRSYVAEPDLGRIQPGMVVEVRTDSGKTYSGQIGFISPVAEFTPKSVETRELRTSLVYRLRVVVNGDTTGLLQGMPVTVETTVKRKP